LQENPVLHGLKHVKTYGFHLKYGSKPSHDSVEVPWHQQRNNCEVGTFLEHIMRNTNMSIVGRSYKKTGWELRETDDRKRMKKMDSYGFIWIHMDSQDTWTPELDLASASALPC
jgi:hypothetical protein